MSMTNEYTNFSETTKSNTIIPHLAQGNTKAVYNVICITNDAACSVKIQQCPSFFTDILMVYV